MLVLGICITVGGFVRIITADKAKPAQGILGWTVFLAGMAIAANS